MKFILGAAFLFLSGAAALAQDDVTAAAARCQACHETSGPSAVPTLNGQRADYILLRLKEFHDPASQTPHATYFMWDIATSLGTAKAKALAAHFAALPPPAARPSGRPAAAAGDTFYHGAGNCDGCHGDQGEGGPPAAPRLAGQHGLYLRQQLESFGLSVRYQSQMVTHSLKLTPDQVSAVVAYLSGD